MITNNKITKYCSLGFNCLPRTFFTEWKIKPRKEDGEKSCVFDLMYMSPESCIYFLENGFTHFYDNLKFNSELGYLYRDEDLFYGFNHDTDIGNDLESLKKRYDNRIKNFYELLKSDENILFIYSIEPNDVIDIKRLYSAIKKLRKGKIFKLMILDFYQFENLYLQEDVVIIKAPYPKEKYVWWHPDYRKSKEGINFEMQLKAKVEQCLESFQAGIPENVLSTDIRLPEFMMSFPFDPLHTREEEKTNTISTFQSVKNTKVFQLFFHTNQSNSYISINILGIRLKFKMEKL